MRAVLFLPGRPVLASRHWCQIAARNLNDFGITASVAEQHQSLRRVLPSYHCVVVHSDARKAGTNALLRRARRRGVSVLRDVDGDLQQYVANRDKAGFVLALRSQIHQCSDQPLTINWVLRAPVGQRGGGYRNIFRLAEYLASRGHAIHIWVEPVAHLTWMSDNQIHRFVENAFGPLRSQVHVGHARLSPSDVTIATNWPTAYTVAEYSPSPFNAYFIQDFEPEFHEQGSPLARDAHNSYFLPLAQICLGRYLARRITGVSGRDADWVDFALDGMFKVNRQPMDRSGPISILFFARPDLKRRGFDIGAAALRLLKSHHPEVQIRMFGASDEEFGHLDFEFQNLGVLGAEELAREMNRAHILLSLSLSNISNVPFEGMACGCAVVESDLPAVADMVNAGEDCLLAAPDPRSVAEGLARLCEDADLRVRLAQNGSTRASKATWENSGKQLEQHLRALCFGRIGAG
jgi:glycosyltransferase involved in cell wall biosynthesis